MKMKRLALVGYPPRYFLSFAQHLEKGGFEIYWITKLRSEVKFLLKKGVHTSRVLDTVSFNKNGKTSSLDALATLELSGEPHINDIILMDRILKTKEYSFSVKYLLYASNTITDFLLENEISMVSSWRDTALQILSMLICKKNNIFWIVPTRIRLPKERYGFCNTFNVPNFLQMRKVTSKDVNAAKMFIDEYHKSNLKPECKKSTDSVKAILSMIPLHLKVFIQAIHDALYDLGNDFTRYTIPKLIRMYMKRRVNFLQLKFSNPFDSIGERPYFLYALHTQPESSIDVVGAYFSDQIALLTQISRSIPVTHDLYVKVHPSDTDGKPLSYYKILSQIPGVKIIGPYMDSGSLIKNASIVFTITGTIAYECGLMKKNAITFADNYFNEFPTVYHCDSPPQLPGLIKNILKNEISNSDNITSQVLDIVSKLFSISYPGEVSRQFSPLFRPLTEDDLDSLLVAYDHLFDKYVL